MSRALLQDPRTPNDDRCLILMAMRPGVVG
jgi:hypothetical protein